MFRSRFWRARYWRARYWGQEFVYGPWRITAFAVAEGGAQEVYAVNPVVEMLAVDAAVDGLFAVEV